jgi:hypothetical protein
MRHLFAESTITLASCVLTLRFRGFGTMLFQLKRQTPAPSVGLPVEVVLRVLEFAAVFLPLRLSSLERSVATAAMLRRYGWPSQLVLGVQVFPSEDYAWVEIDECPVNDTPDVREIYKIIGVF